MTTESNARPFTALINKLRGEGYRYQDLVNRSNEARSSAWFNNLVNSRDPWAVAPPTPDTWEGLASLLHVTQAHLKQAIAAEWFGTERDSELDPEARTLAEVVGGLSVEDRRLIATLAMRLAKPVKTLEELLSEPLPEFDLDSQFGTPTAQDVG